MKRAALLALLLGACGHGSDGAPPLEDIAGLTVVSTISSAGADTIVADITQPLDHAQLGGVAFTQRLVIYEVDPRAPTVLYVEGYGLGAGLGVHELTSLVGGNEVQVEQRFFGNSVPAPADWSKLDFAQGAADLHRVVVALQDRYSGPWLSTGASKGGVDALLHRQSYAADVAGTLAYVAPYATSLRDPRYAAFVATLGDETCRAALRAFQEAVLTEPRRTQLGQVLAAYLTSGPATQHVGVLGADRILELTTRETPFTFWQYGDASRCASIPDVGTSSDDAVIAFLDTTNALASWTDEGLAADQGYWYATATQEGYPDDGAAAIEDVIRYSDPPTPLQLTTEPSPPPFDPAPLQALATWTASSDANIVLLYGENDPWSAGAFTLANSADVHVVPGGNHTSLLRNLPVDEEDDVSAQIRGWIRSAAAR